MTGDSQNQSLPLQGKGLYFHQEALESSSHSFSGNRMFDREGLDLLRLARKQALKRDYPEAFRSFQQALQVRGFDGDLLIHPQYLSHYGASLAGACGKTTEGRRLCERSIQLEPYEPEHYLNLGVVLEMSGNRRDALGAFIQGLAVFPDHPKLQEEFRRVERRRPLPFAFLSRNHPLNRYLGKWIAAFRPDSRH